MNIEKTTAHTVLPDQRSLDGELHRRTMSTWSLTGQPQLDAMDGVTPADQPC